MSSSAASRDPASAGAPPQVRLAALVTAIEGGVLVGFAGYVAISVLVSAADRRSGAVALGVFAAGVGVLLGLLARSLVGLRAWARSPVVVVQILLLPVGVTLLQAGRWLLGAAVLLLAGTVLYLLFTRQSRAALDR